MILVDVGNTRAAFFDGKKVWYVKERDFLNFVPKVRCFYINVNPRLSEFLASNELFVDISPRVLKALNSSYKGLGSDRAAVCLAVKEREKTLVVDAGSAITLDFVSGGEHKGGCIIPGFMAQLAAFANISTKLACDYNENISLANLPLCTQDALSYGAVAPVVALVEKLACELCGEGGFMRAGKFNGDKSVEVVLTGGNGKILSKFIKGSVFDELLIFKGMQVAL